MAYTSAQVLAPQWSIDVSERSPHVRRAARANTATHHDAEYVRRVHRPRRHAHKHLALPWHGHRRIHAGQRRGRVRGVERCHDDALLRYGRHRFTAAETRGEGARCWLPWLGCCLRPAAPVQTQAPVPRGRPALEGNCLALAAPRSRPCCCTYPQRRARLRRRGAVVCTRAAHTPPRPPGLKRRRRCNGARARRGFEALPRH